MEMEESNCLTLVHYVVVSINYRLAPEYPFPTPVENFSYAFKWVRIAPQDPMTIPETI